MSSWLWPCQRLCLCFSKLALAGHFCGGDGCVDGHSAGRGLCARFTSSFVLVINGHGLAPRSVVALVVVFRQITMPDFVLADVTDAIMDGALDSFPATYAQKVGKTSDALYKACGAAYFSMHCSSLFPRCTVPQSFDDVMPVGGRVGGLAYSLAQAFAVLALFGCVCALAWFAHAL